MEIKISKDSSAEELIPIAFHELLGLPVTMRSLNKIQTFLFQEVIKHVKTQKRAFNH